MGKAGVRVQDPTHAADGEGLHCCEESQVNRPPERESESEAGTQQRLQSVPSSCLRFKHYSLVGLHIHASPTLIHSNTHAHTIQALLYIEYSPH